MMSSVLIVGKDKEARQKFIKEKYNPQFPDYIFIDQDESIGIEQIREIEHQIFLKPIKYSVKVVVIENADLLTKEAQNAFLKTLEEPPSQALIILSTDRKNELLPTVLSRCQIYTLKSDSQVNFDKEEYSEYLVQITKGSVADKFTLAEKQGRDKETALEFLEKLSLFLEENLSEKNANLCHQIIKTRKYIDSNINPRFALENLFIKC